MPIYEFKCEVCERSVDSLEPFDTNVIEVECFCQKGLKTKHIRTLYPDASVAITGDFGTPKRPIK